MAEFAIGAISTLASRAPQIQLPGTVPHLGSELQVFWPYAIGLLVAIAVTHFGISFFVIWFTKHVIVKDDSNLAVAKLLRPLVDRLGNSGTLLDGAAISRAIGEKPKFVYGVRRPTEPASGDYYLDIAEDILPRKSKERHPNGTYR